MCEQIKVLEKIRKKGAVNGYANELAEAQAKDFVLMDKKVSRIEKDVGSIKKEQKKQGEMLAKLGGQMELVINRMNSPVDAERADGIFWKQVKDMLKTTTGRIVVLLIIGCVGLAGQRILELFGLIK